MVNRKKVALVVLLVVMTSACFAAAPYTVVVSNPSVGFVGYLCSIFGNTVGLCDPVPGGGGGGGYG